MTDLVLAGIGMTSQRTRERLVQRLSRRGIENIAVLDVMRSTPRHIFLDEALAHRAYEDEALPIGLGQTLSQPYMVARMTELLLTDGPLAKVLELGTGSGYQAAVLAQLVGQVYTVERIKPLLENARQRLRRLQLYNVRFRHADGAHGWADEAPFDAIIATAAPRQIPENLLQQLRVGGRLVIPVGEDGKQELQVIVRTDDGYRIESVEPVRFVPLVAGVIR